MVAPVTMKTNFPHCAGVFRFLNRMLDRVASLDIRTERTRRAVRLLCRTACCLLVCNSYNHPLGAQVVVDSVNADKTPWHAFGFGFFGNESGWLYTPSFTYSLNGVFTRFNTGEGRSVTVEVFAGLPYEEQAPLLASSTFSVQPAGFSGGFFDPITMVEGHAYFIGFKGVADIFNVTYEEGSTPLLGYHWGHGGGGRYEVDQPNGAVTPILQFMTIPEPSVLVFLVLILSAALFISRKTLIPKLLGANRMTQS